MISAHSGLVLLNKPSGITSFRVLNSLKKKLDTGKVGHTGTLDKFAEGLMLVLTGKMTKLAPFFSNMDKEYIASYKFGEETETLDPEGKVIAYSEIPTLETIEKNLSGFMGEIMQQPPDFSAIHINGQRAYKLAAAGKKPLIPKRSVKIYKYEIQNWNPPFLSVKVKCSKGTYIRSLARDLGIACNSRAYVSALSRTEVGNWNIKDSVLPDNFDPDKNILSGKNLFNMINSINIYTVSELQADMILKGLPIRKWIEKNDILTNGFSALFDKKDNFLALIENTDGNCIYKFVQERPL
ncbi:MAG: tRNA pseudouridine(55) synthase TruB [Spirochaetales bacterium]|nr:tRNA pseudouridine(55) synthase TruB [Spirochaetales bacterium]